MRNLDLHTPRLHLQHVEPSDSWELWELLDTPAIRVPLLRGHSIPMEAMAGFLAPHIAQAPSLWVMRARRTARALGFVSIRGLLPSASSLRGTGPHELILALSPAVRGMGYATEAAHAVIEHAFDSLQVDRLTAMCPAKDTHSGTLLDSLGFQLCAVHSHQDTLSLEFELHACAYQPLAPMSADHRPAPSIGFADTVLG